MTNFHPHTIAGLRNELRNWREQLENAESELKYREEQATKAREIAEAARQRVADYERLLAVVEPAKDEPDSGICPTHGHPLDERGMCPVAIDFAASPVGQVDDATEVQTDDEALAMDAEEYHASIWTDAIATASTAQLEGVACINCARVFGSEPNYSAATGPRGPLFAHSYPNDCKAVIL